MWWTSANRRADRQASISRPRPEAARQRRGFRTSLNSAFHDNDLMLRIAGDTLALTAALDRQRKTQIGENLSRRLRKVIRAGGLASPHS